MVDLTPEKLAELKALEKAATPGPWVTRFDGAVYREVVRGEVPVCEHASREEAALIAALRNAAPAMIAAAEERDELRADRDRINDKLGELNKIATEVADGADADLAEINSLRALLVRAGEAMERRKAFKEEAYSNKDVFDCAVATIDFEFDLLFAEIRRATQTQEPKL